MAGCNRQSDINITLAELTSDPVRYNGKEINVEGFYFGGFEVQVIAERLEYSGYAEGHLVPKGEMIWVEGGIPVDVYNEFPTQDMMGPTERYGKVRISGKFEYGGKYGHLGEWDLRISPAKVEILEWFPPSP